jgi:hypothetical protein
LIQVSSRPGAGAAQARIVPAKSRSTATSKPPLRTARRSERDTRSPSSGMIPRSCGSIQRSFVEVALSAIGNTPAA